MTRLEKTSVQLSPETLAWLDGWPGVSRSEALRLALDRAQYLVGQMEDVSDLALRFRSVLTPALADLRCEDFRTAARALPALVGSYIQENDNRGWVDDQGSELDTSELHQRLQAMHSAQRIYLLDCIVAGRDQSTGPGRVTGALARRRSAKPTERLNRGRRSK